MEKIEKTEKKLKNGRWIKEITLKKDWEDMEATQKNK
jgi:hypothetical protein